MSSAVTYRSMLLRSKVLELRPGARAEYRSFRGVYILDGSIELAHGFTAEQAWGKALVRLRGDSQKTGAA